MTTASVHPDQQPEVNSVTTDDDRLRYLTTESVHGEFRDIDRLSILETLQLINEQDATVAVSVAACLPQLAAALPSIVERLKAGGRIIYAGAGTSGRLGVLDAAECGPTFGAAHQVIALIAGGPSAVTNAAEGAEDDRAAAVRDLQAIALSNHDAVVGITASGRTPYACAAVEYARALGALTVGVSCNSKTELSKLVDYPVEVNTGPEVIAGSTRMKAATAQKMVLNMISSTAMIKLGKTHGNMMLDLRISNEKLFKRGVRIVAEIGGVSENIAADALRAHDLSVRATIDWLAAQAAGTSSSQ